MTVTKEQLRDKLFKMPHIKQSLRKIKTKDGREYYIIETRITQFISPKYLDAVMKGGRERPEEKKDDDIY